MEADKIPMHIGVLEINHTCGVLVLRQLSWAPPEEVLQYQPEIFFIITRERIQKQV